MRPRLLTSLAAGIALAAALALSGCTPSSPADSATNTGTLHVVASTRMWGDIAQAIAGPNVQVTNLIDSESTNPHEYVASARDLLAIEHADIVLMNGNGYDDFAHQLIDASATQANIIDVSTLSPRGTDNEHYWWDLDTVRAVAAFIAATLSERDPANATGYASRGAEFVAQLNELSAQLAAANTANQTQPPAVLMTEPLPAYLFAEAGFTDATPPALSRAVENGTDIPASALAEAQARIRAGEVDVLALNASEQSAQTDALAEAADQAGIPVLRLNENLPAGAHYREWMRNMIAQVVTIHG